MSQTLRKFEDIPKWIEANLWIISDLGEGRGVRLIRFKLNVHQWRLWDMIEAQYQAGVPVRIIILKARQLGFSTFIEAFGFALTVLYSHLNGLVVAHDDESTTELFDKTVIFRNNLGDVELRPIRRSNKKEIIWDHPHNSRLACQTGGKERLGRSGNYQFGHISELAFLTHPTKSMTSLLNAIHHKPLTFIFIESTANGVGGEFAERWDRATSRTRKAKDLNGFTPLFIGWLDHVDYQMPVHTSYEWGPFDDDELMLKAMGAMPEQLYWRRWKIDNDFNGDVELFKQEFPATPSEAFRHSGRRAIPDVITNYHRSTAKPGTQVRFELDAGCEVTGVRRDVALPGTHYWTMWKEVVEDHDYVVFGDVAEGQLADPTDEKSDPDWHAAYVMDRVTLELVARFHDRIDGDIYGEELVKAARYYNFAWATPEMNSCGMAPLMVFKRENYSRTYQREGAEDGVQVKDSPYCGWRTHGPNRDLMIDDYIAYTRPDPIDGFNDRLVCYDDELAFEEESFTHVRHGMTTRRQHQHGTHDDLFWAAAGCIALHRRCPRTRRTRAPRPYRKAAQTLSDLAMAGAVDAGLDVLEDGDDEFTG